MQIPKNGTFWTLPAIYSLKWKVSRGQNSETAGNGKGFEQRAVQAQFPEKDSLSTALRLPANSHDPDS